MNYTSEVLQILPIVSAVSALVYLAIFLASRRRRRPHWRRIVSEFLLTEATVAFVYVTQVMEFGNEMGKLVNLEPLRSFSIAAKYGLINAGGFVQLVLNVLITVPLGVLLPLVFPRWFGRIRRVFLIGLALTIATELLQSATGRHADIDDVIANSAGVALGTALVTVVCAVARRIPGGRWGPRRLPAISRWQVSAAVAVILGVVAPFVTVVAINGGNRLGTVYYGHLRPSAVRVPTSISVQGANAKLYHFAEVKVRAEILSRLRSRFGIKSDCDTSGETWTCRLRESVRLFIDPRNRWSIAFDYGRAAQGNPALVPNEKAGRKLAHGYLADAGINPRTLTYSGIDKSYKDGYLHLDYANRKQTDDALLWGKVSVTIGDKGKLIALDNTLIPVKLVQSVETISPRSSIAIAQDVGVGSVPATASVHSVVASHYFDEDSGYLIPVWNIQGTLTMKNGQVVEWNPIIEARS